MAELVGMGKSVEGLAVALRHHSDYGKKAVFLVTQDNQDAPNDRSDRKA